MSSKDLAKNAAAQQKKTPDTLMAALTSGNPIVLASCLVMGLANMAAGQMIKGLIFLAIEIAYIVFLAIPMGGAHWLSMLPGLGEVEQIEIYNEEEGFFEYLPGDNSQQILLYAVATLVITILFIVIWRASVRSGQKAHCVFCVLRQYAGVQNP